MTAFIFKHWFHQLFPTDHQSSTGRRLWLRGWLGPDLIAGATAAAVVIPMAMAYAALAGLPPEIGIYSVLIPMAVYVLLGSSPVLSVSTTTTLGILTAAALKDAVPTGDAASLAQMAATLAFLVGLLLILAGILRLGMIANFISDPVLTGFKSGIGLAIIVDQIPKLIGLHIDKSWFGHDVVELIGNISAGNPATAFFGCSLIGLLFLLRHWMPSLPAPIFVIVLSILLAPLIDYPAHGVAQIGTLPKGLPQIKLPSFDNTWLTSLKQLLPSAAAIALMSFTETIAAGNAFAPPGRPRPRANREMIALGFGNLIGGLFGCMPAGGGTTQTAVNRLAGARSQVAAAVTVLGAALVLLFLAPTISRLPATTLAAVVIAYSIGLINPRELRAILRVRRREFFWAIIALLGVLLLGTIQGILVAVATSLLSLAYQTNNPPVYVLGSKPGTDVLRLYDPHRHRHDVIYAGLMMLRVEGRLYFANSQIVIDHVRALIDRYHPRVIALDLSAVSDIEYTVLKSLAEIDDQLREAGIILWLAGLNHEVHVIFARTELGRSMAEETHAADGPVGHGRLFRNIQEALAAYLAQERPAADGS